jgi:hypothetical protein
VPAPELQGGSHGLLAGENNAAILVDLDDLDHDLVTDVGDLLNPVDGVVGELRDGARPSFPGRISTKAPEFMMRTTLPL